MKTILCIIGPHHFIHQKILKPLFLPNWSPLTSCRSFTLSWSLSLAKKLRPIRTFVPSNYFHPLQTKLSERSLSHLQGSPRQGPAQEQVEAGLVPPQAEHEAGALLYV